LLLAGSAAAGCGSYFRDRIADLHESVLYDVQVGVGLEADVRISLLDVGVGYSAGLLTWGKVDWWGGAYPEAFRELNCGPPVTFVAPIAATVMGPRALLVLPMTHAIQRVDRNSETDLETCFAFLGVKLPNGSPLSSWHTPVAPARSGWIDAFGFEAGAFVGPVGMRAGLNLAELADFLTGVVGLDLLGDDRLHEIARETIFYREEPGVEDLIFSPDGALLACCGSSGVTLRDAVSGAVLHRIDGPAQRLAFSPDGSRLAASSNEEVRIFALLPEPWEVLRLDVGRVPSLLVWSPDGRRLAAGDGMVRIWNVESGEELNLADQEPGMAALASVEPLALSPSSGLVVLDRNGKPVVWDLSGKRPVSRLEGHRGGFTDASFSLRGSRVATTGSDGTVRVWDTKRGRELLRLRTYGFDPVCVALAPCTDRLVAAGRGGHAVFFDLSPMQGSIAENRRGP
jgi:hypothetical protein